MKISVLHFPIRLIKAEGWALTVSGPISPDSAPIFAKLSEISFPGTLLCPGTQTRVAGFLRESTCALLLRSRTLYEQILNELIAFSALSLFEQSKMGIY